MQTSCFNFHIHYFGLNLPTTQSFYEVYMKAYFGVLLTLRTESYFAEASVNSPRLVCKLS